MKYTVEIDIDLTRSRVIELFDDPENLKHWQPDLVSFEHFEGERGQPGAKSKILHKMGKREVEMIETILVRNLPDEFSGTYEADGVENEVRNYFSEDGENKTHWVTEVEFKFKGFMRIIAFFMPSMFRKQTLQFMKNFKEFAESRK